MTNNIKQENRTKRLDEILRNIVFTRPMDLNDAKEIWSDAQVILKEREHNTIDACIEVVENRKRKPTEHQIPCPDGIVGCLVFHFEMRLSDEDRIYNQACDDIIKDLKALK